MVDSTKILVTGLHLGVNEASILQEFKKFGDIQYIRLKNYSGRVTVSISFVNSESASKARAQMNGKILFGYRIFVCLSDCFPIKDCRSNIFIKNIPLSIDAIQLEETFKSFGKIVNSKISYDENNQSRGYGFIMYEKNEEADLAVAKGNNAQIMNNILIVQHFIPKQYRTAMYTNIYVRGFNNDYSQEKLLEVFSRYGDVVSAVINKKNDSCFGFVCFTQAKYAENAIAELHGKKDINGIEWYLSKNISKSERIIENKLKMKKNEEKWIRTNLYIKGWPIELNEQQLIGVFSKFGRIDSVKILTQEYLTLISNYPIAEKRPTGQAFISFYDEKSADTAIYQMKNTLINNSRLKLYRWVPKNKFYKGRYIKNKNQHKIPKAFIKMSDPVHYFNYERLKNARIEDRKRLFGEAIYQELFNQYDKWTGKITGMIIELDESELLPMMENKSLLYAKANEAMNILNSEIITRC